MGRTGSRMSLRGKVYKTSRKSVRFMISKEMLEKSNTYVEINHLRTVRGYKKHFDEIDLKHRIKINRSREFVIWENIKKKLRKINTSVYLCKGYKFIYDGKVYDKRNSVILFLFEYNPQQKQRVGEKHKILIPKGPIVIEIVVNKFCCSTKKRIKTDFVIGKYYVYFKEKGRTWKFDILKKPVEYSQTVL